jgi:hypothetical protein
MVLVFGMMAVFFVVMFSSILHNPTQPAHTQGLPPAICFSVSGDLAGLFGRLGGELDPRRGLRDQSEQRRVGGLSGVWEAAAAGGRMTKKEIRTPLETRWQAKKSPHAEFACGDLVRAGCQADLNLTSSA